MRPLLSPVREKWCPGIQCERIAPCPDHSWAFPRERFHFNTSYAGEDRPHSWLLSFHSFTHSSRDKQWTTKVWLSLLMVAWGTELRIHDTILATSLKFFMSRIMGHTLYNLLTFILSCKWGTILENVSLLFLFAFLCIPSIWSSLGPGRRGSIKVRDVLQAAGFPLSWELWSADGAGR